MFTRKYLDELLKKFPTPSFPNNKFFKGVKVRDDEIKFRYIILFNFFIMAIYFRG